MGEFYHPHISVGRLKRGKIPDDYLKWEEVEMKVKGLILGRGEVGGTVRKVENVTMF